MKLMSILGALIIFVLGFFAGIKYMTNKVNFNNINIIPVGCTYEGTNYKNGEGFKDKDGCNSCSCQNGQIACTEMACLPD